MLPATCSLSRLALHLPQNDDKRITMVHLEKPAVLVPPIAGHGAQFNPRDGAHGILLVAASAITWSTGGTIARYIETGDSWTIVFWRSVAAAAFLLLFMIWRDGPKGAASLFGKMGLPGFLVGACFATASTAFIVALHYTTVANILLMQAGVPLIAALMSWLLFRERVMPATWIAIAVVVAGVATMVSDSLGGGVSPIGDGLALLIAFAFATATVITRRYAHVRMTPAVCTGTLMAAAFSSLFAGGFAVTAHDGGLLFVFGALNMGLGMAFFASGAPRVPSAITALIGTLETILGPLWVWLLHGETPSIRTITGGGIILAALLAHVIWQLLRQRRVPLVPTAN